jgi:hypothetical protein
VAGEEEAQWNWIRHRTRRQEQYSGQVLQKLSFSIGGGPLTAPEALSKVERRRKLAKPATGLAATRVRSDSRGLQKF